MILWVGERKHVYSSTLHACANQSQQQVTTPSFTARNMDKMDFTVRISPLTRASARGANHPSTPPLPDRNTQTHGLISA